MQELIKERTADWFLIPIKACSIAQRYALAFKHHLYLILMNLDITELGVLVHALVDEGFSLHVNHQAVLALIDNLAERAMMNNAEGQAIKTLQIAILNKAIEHHRSKGHCHVVPTLNALRETCKSNTYSLMDEEEFDLDSTSADDNTPSSDQQPDSHERSAPGTSVSSYTLGDGNCLYNSVAIGLSHSPDALQKCWKACMALLARQTLFDLPLIASREEGIKTQSQFIDNVLALPHDALQRELAPVLRSLACTYLIGKRRQLNTNIYMLDNVYLTNLLQLNDGAPLQEDHMGLSHVDFIRQKAAALQQQSSSLNEKVDDFQTWWSAEGENQYLRYISVPANAEHGLSRWGSEIELSALSDCLEITIAYQYNGTTTLLGPQQGVYPQAGLYNNDVTPEDLSLLKARDLAESVTYFEIEQKTWTTNALRFKTGALETLDLLRTSLSHDGFQLTPLNSQQFFQYIDRTAREQGKTALQYMQDEGFNPEFLMALDARAILVQGKIITDGGIPDYPRIAQRLHCLTPEAYELLQALLVPTTPLFTTIFSNSHWQCQSNNAAEHNTSTSSVLPASSPVFHEERLGSPHLYQEQLFWTPYQSVNDDAIHYQPESRI